MRQMIGVTEKGARVGQDHHRAKLTNRDVELIRQMHEEKIARSVIAEKFDVSVSTVDKIANYRRRNIAPARYRRAR